jgi:membrane fusion protein, heavy metal efflux system
MDKTLFLVKIKDKKLKYLISLVLGVFLFGCAKHDHSEKTHSEKKDNHKIIISDIQAKDYDIKYEKVRNGKIKKVLEVNGEVDYNPLKVTHLVPWVSGIVQKVYVQPGQKVLLSAPIVSLKSRELSQLNINYLSSLQKVYLSQKQYGRENSLFKKGITSKKNLENSQYNLSVSYYEKQVSERKLKVLGITKKQLKILLHSKKKKLAEYNIIAPFAGTIIEQHIVVGEFVDRNSKILTIADLDLLWVKFKIYSKDLNSVKKGQKIIVKATSGKRFQNGVVDYVSQIIDRTTRTGKIRIILNNKSRKWKIGEFVKGELELSEKEKPFVIKKSAVQKLNGKTCVFIKNRDGIFPRIVKLGIEDEKYISIEKGLKEGEIYVSKGSFIVKSQLLKEGLKKMDNHNH